METFAPDPGLLVWTLITFGLLLAVLARFAFRPLRRVLEEREAVIRAAVDGARRAAEQAEQVRRDSESHLLEARQQAQAVIEEGRRLANEIRKEAAARAREDARHITEQARGEIDREAARALEELRGTVANLSLRVARQIVTDHIDEQRHEELVDYLIDRLKSRRGSQS